MSKKSPATIKAAKKPAPPRVRGVKRPPMKKSFIGNFLDRGIRPRRKLKNNNDVSKYILNLALKDLDGVPITGPNPETDERIARMMASEIAAALNRTEGKSAKNWYTDAIHRSIQIAGMMHPEILDDDAAMVLVHPSIRSAADARTILFAAMAITSQSVPVTDNMRYALEQYRYFLAHGEFAPKGYGVKGSSIRNNLKRFNYMLEVFDQDIGELKAFLDTDFTMRELKEAGDKFGIRVVSKEMADEMVHGSILFGPKIGAFYQNLCGQHGSLTADLWFCRTWGRYTGTLVRDDVSPAQVDRLASTLRHDFLTYGEAMKAEGLIFDPDAIEEYESEDLLDLCKKVHKFWETRRKEWVAAGFSNAQISIMKSRLGWPGASEAIMKSLSGTVDQPGSGGRRRWMRSVVNRAVQILRRNGYPMTVADAQATLWFPEKDLYDVLAGRKLGSLTVSYDEALQNLAVKEGFTNDQIRAALRTGGDAEQRGHGFPETAGRGDAGELQGDGPGTLGNGEGQEIREVDLLDEVAAFSM